MIVKVVLEFENQDNIAELIKHWLVCQAAGGSSQEVFTDGGDKLLGELRVLGVGEKIEIVER